MIVIGEVATGKSALIKRYVHNFFGSKAHYRATLGVDFQLKMLKFNDEMDIRLQLWDIAGQERFSSMTRAYYKGAVGAVVVFDNVRKLGNHLECFSFPRDADFVCFLWDCGGICQVSQFFLGSRFSDAGDIDFL